MKCLLKYQWVKLLRAHLPQGKGVMGYWARLAARAAFVKVRRITADMPIRYQPVCGPVGSLASRAFSE